MAANLGCSHRIKGVKVYGTQNSVEHTYIRTEDRNYNMKLLAKYSPLWSVKMALQAFLI